MGFIGFAIYGEVFRRPRISFENLQMSKRTDDGKAEQLAISPDKRYVAYAVQDAAESGLRVRQVETCSNVQILLPDKDRERFLGLTFSPDGNYIYYVQSSKEIASYNYLYKAPVLGGPALLLGKYADTPVSFSPNGQEFAFTRASETETFLRYESPRQMGVATACLRLFRMEPRISNPARRGRRMGRLLWFL